MIRHILVLAAVALPPALPNVASGGGSVEDVIAQLSPKIYYPLENDLTDASGNEQHGTPESTGVVFDTADGAGSPGYSPSTGIDTHAGSFNGPLVPFYDFFEGDGTIGLWVRWDGINSLDANIGLIGKRDNWGGNNAFGFGYSDDSRLVGGLSMVHNRNIAPEQRFNDADGNGITLPPAPDQPAPWTHLAVAVEDGLLFGDKKKGNPPLGTATLYVNGEQASTVPWFWGEGGNAILSVGSSYSDVEIRDGEFFPGWLDEVWFFDRTLSAEEIRLFANISATVAGNGDVNNDGSVDNLDITPFIAALAAEDETAFLAAFPEGNYAAADIDTSGGPDNLDITPFIDLLTVAGAAIPEPASVTLLLLMLMGMRRARRGGDETRNESSKR